MPTLFTDHFSIAPLYAGDVAEKALDTAEAGADAAVRQIDFLAKFFSSEQLFNYFIAGIRIVVLLLFLFILWRVLRYLLRNIILRQKYRAGVENAAQLGTAGHLLESILGYGIIFIGIVGVLSILGFDMRGLVASAGVAGLMIAFVSQSIIKDWVSGLFIIAERQHTVGDWVIIAGQEGQVQSVGMRSTVLRTWYNETVYVPNGNIREVINLSQNPQRCVFDLGVDYRAEIDHTRRVLEKVCHETTAAHFEDIDEAVRILGIERLDASAVVWRLTFTARNMNHKPILRDLQERAKLALDAAGIDIPFQQVTLHNATPKKEDASCP